MSEDYSDEPEKIESNTPSEVAIENRLPLTAIDIESQKDMQSGRYHALRGLHKWFAARPTPAVRLAIIASAYPNQIDSDQLLKLLQAGPKALDEDLSEYIIKKYNQSKNGKGIDEHYGYPNPNTQSPTKSELEELHATISDAWGGELPTVLDPTAGRGIIPFESTRYGFPTIANELNPIPSVIINVGVKYAPKVGSVKEDVNKWRDKIHEEAKANIQPYYPTKEPGREILNSACTYLLECESCSGQIPLTSKWWIYNRPRSQDTGIAVKPIYENGNIDYRLADKSEIDNGEFDPDDGPVTRGDAECPHCGVVTEEGEIRESIRNGDFDYSVYGVNYQNESGERKYRAGTEIDAQGMKKAAERLENDFNLLDYLAEPIEEGLNTSQIKRYGMDQWRDIFTPRQLVVHYEYLQSYKKFKSNIEEHYSEEKSTVILTLLSLGSSRAFSFNSRLSQWYDSYGYPDPLFSDNNYAMKKMFGDNNLAAPRRGYIQSLGHVVDSYEELSSYTVTGEIQTVSQDAATLSNSVEQGSVDIAVVDPPYYSSIMYGELSEGYYAIQKGYLQDVYPDLFNSKLPNKENEAVANPARFSQIANDNQSKKQLANEYYESKMKDIFSEIYKLLNSGGVMTVMFTHREMDAWDTLTTALIEAGFTITATHPIKTEKTDRVGLQGKSSADSSILLVGRKVTGERESGSTLWEEIKDDISQAAEMEAKDIISSGYNISKTDMAIATYGPTLQKYASVHPVVNKKGEKIRPREALSKARQAVTKVIAENFLDTKGIDGLDTLTRWYILSWLTYESDTFPYDEGNQLGVAAGVDIDEIKRSTKIWGKYRGDIQLKDHTDRVQDIVLLKDDTVDNPSSRKYPVNPTDSRFTYTVDTVHSAIHVYEREGARAAWDWITERNLKSDDTFGVAVSALLEVLPEDEQMHETLVNLISGETGEYLDINVDDIDIGDIDRQTSLGDHI